MNQEQLAELEKLNLEGLITGHCVCNDQRQAFIYAFFWHEIEAMYKRKGYSETEAKNHAIQYNCLRCGTTRSYASIQLCEECNR